MDLRVDRLEQRVHRRGRRHEHDRGVRPRSHRRPEPRCRNIGIPSIEVPPAPGFVPPTTLVPYSFIARGVETALAPESLNDDPSALPNKTLTCGGLLREADRLAGRLRPSSRAIRAARSGGSLRPGLGLGARKPHHERHARRMPLRSRRGSLSRPSSPRVMPPEDVDQSHCHPRVTARSRAPLSRPLPSLRRPRRGSSRRVRPRCAPASSVAITRPGAIADDSRRRLSSCTKLNPSARAFSSASSSGETSLSFASSVLPEEGVVVDVEPWRRRQHGAVL